MTTTISGCSPVLFGPPVTTTDVGPRQATPEDRAAVLQFLLEETSNPAQSEPRHVPRSISWIALVDTLPFKQT